MKNIHFIKLYFGVLESDLTPNESMMLCFLLHWSELKKNDKIQISNEYISKKLKINTRTVIRIKKKFIADGLMEVKFEPLNGSGKKETTYYLKMEEINRRFFEKEAQNEDIIKNEYQYATNDTNASNCPIGYSENQEYEDEVNVAESNPIEIDDEEERNVISHSDFVIAGDNVENDFRQLLRENVDLMGCMSYDGLTKYPIAYKFLTSNDISRQTVDRVLSEERKRRMENKWAI